MTPADRDASLRAHLRRVAALAMEVGRLAGLPLSLQPALEEAALLHHALDMGPAPSGLGRLAWHVACAQPDDASGRIAGIVRFCNLVDEQFEALELDYQDTETILAGLQELAPLEGFDPSLVTCLQSLQAPLPHGDSLPVEMRTARRVFGLLAPNREYDVPELAAIAAQDPVLAASILRTANSSLYMRATRVAGLPRAISYLGTDRSRAVMRAAALRPVFAGAGLTRQWQHAVQVAQVCERLATHTPYVSSEEALILGLLHDLGSLAIQFLPRETRDTYARLVERGCPPAYVERILFGRDHGEIGAELLSAWDLPEEWVTAVRLHHQPERSRDAHAPFLYLAEFWSGNDEDLPSFHRLQQCLKRTGLSLDALTETNTKGASLDLMRITA